MNRLGGSVHIRKIFLKSPGHRRTSNLGVHSFPVLRGVVITCCTLKGRGLLAGFLKAFFCKTLLKYIFSPVYEDYPTSPNLS